MAGVRQDMPPKGGYPAFRFRPQQVAKPRRGRGLMIYGFIAAVSVWGTWVMAGHNRRERRAKELQATHQQLSSLLPMLPPSR